MTGDVNLTAELMFVLGNLMAYRDARVAAGDKAFGRVIIFGDVLTSPAAADQTPEEIVNRFGRMAIRSIGIAIYAADGMHGMRDAMAQVEAMGDDRAVAVVAHAWSGVGKWVA